MPLAAPGYVIGPADQTPGPHNNGECVISDKPDKTTKDKIKASKEPVAKEPSTDRAERGRILQWTPKVRPVPASMRAPSHDDGYDDESYGYGEHQDTITSRIFYAERRMLNPRMARTWPLAPWLDRR